MQATTVPVPTAAARPPREVDVISIDDESNVIKIPNVDDGMSLHSSDIEIDTDDQEETDDVEENKAVSRFPYPSHSKDVKNILLHPNMHFYLSISFFCREHLVLRKAVFVEKTLSDANFTETRRRMSSLKGRRSWQSCLKRTTV